MRFRLFNVMLAMSVSATKLQNPSEVLLAQLKATTDAEIVPALIADLLKCFGPPAAEVVIKAIFPEER